MKIRDIIKRLEEIRLDPHLGRMSLALADLINELKNDSKRYNIKRGEEYWCFLGWTRSKTLASKYSREGAEKMLKVLGWGELEEA